eukprot:gene6177-8507_t
MQAFILLLVLFVVSTHAFMSGFNSARRCINSHMEMKVTGRVKFFDTTKGFGFITPDGGGEDIFVHQTAIYSQGFRSLAEGEPVEFDITDDKEKRKKFATNVTGPNGAHVQGAPPQSSAPRRERY